MSQGAKTSTDMNLASLAFSLADRADKAGLAMIELVCSGISQLYCRFVRVNHFHFRLTNALRNHKDSQET